MSPSGSLWQENRLNGSYLSNIQIAKCNGAVQSNLNASLLNGFHSFDFSQAGHQHNYAILASFYADVYAADGVTFVQTYQIRIRSASPTTWWGYSTY